MEAAGCSEYVLNEDGPDEPLTWLCCVEDAELLVLVGGMLAMGAGSTSGAMVSQPVKRGREGPAICSCNVAILDERPIVVALRTEVTPGDDVAVRCVYRRMRWKMLSSSVWLIASGEKVGRLSYLYNDNNIAMISG